MTQQAYQDSQSAKRVEHQREAVNRKVTREIEGHLQYGAHYGQFHPDVLATALEPLSDEDRIATLAHALDMVVLDSRETARLVIDCLAYAVTVFEAITADTPTRPLPDVFAVAESDSDDADESAE